MLRAYLLLIYVVSTADAAIFGFNLNLNWLRQTAFGHADSRENRKLRQGERAGVLSSLFDKLNQIGSIGTPCDMCKMTLSAMKESMAEGKTPLATALGDICQDGKVGNGLFDSICENLHLYNWPSSDEGFSFFPDFANALSEMDPNSIDGEYLCHYMFSNSCPRPQTPVIDYSQYWPVKPVPSKQMVRSNKTFNVLHVSDVHLSINYTEHAPANCLGAMCCDSSAYQNPLQKRIEAPKFGHWRCDCPQALLDSAVHDCSHRTNNDYEFALFTGDMVDHNPVLISKEDTEQEEIRTMNALKRYLGKTPVYPVLGNHDSYPYSQEPPESSKYARRTSYNLELMQHMWSKFGWMDDEASEKFRATHGGYAIEPMPGLKVITLNSNYWYRWNFYNYVGMEDPDPSGIIQFLISELVDCEERGLRAWVQAHVPPGGLSDEALPPSANFLAATLARFSDVITGLFFGHTHLDEFSVLYAHNASERIEDNALNVAWIAPSITPYTDLNPGWRYYIVDSGSFEIMDAVTVYADIESRFGLDWSFTPDLDWTPLYSAREQYADIVGWPTTEPLNGKFWHRVADEFLYGPEFTDMFVRRSYRNSSRAPDCSDYDCRSERYCYATSMTPDQVLDCHDQYHSGKRWKAGRHRINLGHGALPNTGWRKDYLNPFKGFPTFPMPRPDRFMKKLTN